MGLVFNFIITALLVICTVPMSFTGKVVKVSDGDTIDVMHEGKAERIRLYGIDCPEISHNSKEKGQPFGQNAKKFAADLVAGKEVTVIVKDVDQYGRTVGILEVDNGIVLNEELLKAGFAWHYKQYDNNAEWQKMEDEARRALKGLWSGEVPIAPWDWRHHKMATSPN